MDRQEQIEILMDHYERPRHRHEGEHPDVTMPGGNPGCGDVITVYLDVSEDGEAIKDVSWIGEGCTISQSAASILMEIIHDEQWSLEDVVNTDYHAMVDILGEEAVRMRPKCATLALGTLKAAVKKYRRDRMLADAGLESVDEENAELGIVTGESALQREP